VGNKLDMSDQRIVSESEVKKITEQNQMEYFETSALLNQGIDEMMNHIMTKVYEKKFKEALANAPAQEEEPEEPNSRKSELNVRDARP